MFFFKRHTPELKIKCLGNLDKVANLIKKIVIVNYFLKFCAQYLCMHLLLKILSQAL